MLSLWANWLVTKFGLNSLKRYLWPVLYKHADNDVCIHLNLFSLSSDSMTYSSMVKIELYVQCQVPHKGHFISTDIAGHKSVQSQLE